MKKGIGFIIGTVFVVALIGGIALEDNNIINDTNNNITEIKIENKVENKVENTVEKNVENNVDNSTENKIENFFENTTTTINPPTTTKTEVKKQETTYQYILNTNTKKFHYSSCSSVSKMKESNKQVFNGTRDEAISMGYTPCQRCKP